MSILFDEIVPILARAVLSKQLGPGEAEEIPAGNLKEYHNISYRNRVGKELMMDIFCPDLPPETELPVIVNIHGGGLIMRPGGG